MKKILISLSILILAAGIFSGEANARDYRHIDLLFEVRNEITGQGRGLPNLIRSSVGNDLRTLERIFELNTSALTTVEAYFRIFKIAVATGNEADPDSVKILNEWLSFISNQCTYDMDYLNEAIRETNNAEVAGQIELAKTNIQKLAEIARSGIEENEGVLKEDS